MRDDSREDAEPSTAEADSGEPAGDDAAAMPTPGGPAAPPAGVPGREPPPSGGAAGGAGGGAAGGAAGETADETIDDPGDPTPRERAPGPGPGPGAPGPGAPARPMGLWPVERRLPSLAATPDEARRLETALADAARRLSLVEEGRGGPDAPGPVPPATIPRLESELSWAVEPLARAFEDGAPSPPAAAGHEASVEPVAPGEAGGVPAEDAGPPTPRLALRDGLHGWALAVLAGRLCVAAREHGRSLIPASLTAEVPDFAARHVASARAGHGVDRDFLRQSRARVRPLADAAWLGLAASEDALEAVRPALRRAAATLLESARHRLVRLERWGWETCLHEPDPGVVGGWTISLAARLGPPRWIAPEGVPPRPVIDDVEQVELVPPSADGESGEVPPEPPLEPGTEPRPAPADEVPAPAAPDEPPPPTRSRRGDGAPGGAGRSSSAEGAA